MAWLLDTNVLVNTRNRIPIPIPNAAAALGVSYASPWRMLRAERPLFVLGGVA